MTKIIMTTTTNKKSMKNKFQFVEKVFYNQLKNFYPIRPLDHPDVEKSTNFIYHLYDNILFRKSINNKFISYIVIKGAKDPKPCQYSYIYHCIYEESFEIKLTSFRAKNIRSYLYLTELLMKEFGLTLNSVYLQVEKALFKSTI